MKITWRSIQPIASGILLTTSLLTASLLTAAAYAQQIPPGQSPDPNSAAPANSQVPVQIPLQQSVTTPLPSPIYRDLDLLRRDGFAGAHEASVSVRVVDRYGVTPGNLQSSDFTLIVNGTPRVARLHAPGHSTTSVVPLVLLVFPPNQPIVHSIGAKKATQYFSHQPAELLPWKVGILDSNGKLTPFTDGRTQLLAYLDAVAHATEPFQFTSDAGSPTWNGSWITKAEDAISTMQRFDGPKVILAMNPLAVPTYSFNERRLANDGPESLIGVAQHIGAHIYIANVGGPEPIIPGGNAAEHQPAQVVGGNDTLQLGSVPSANMQMDPRQTAALNYYAYRTSTMMQTAGATLGGFANSLNDLAAQIHRDLDWNYSLDFDLTPEDSDRGYPSVAVRLARHDLRVAILDVVPIGSSDAHREMASKDLMDTLIRATRQPISSPDYRITQHADYFPLHGGLEPLVPMTGNIEWTGRGPDPQQISVVESVEDLTLSSVLLERDIQASWNLRSFSGRPSFSWERDGQLRPGHYLWRVAVHDGKGKVFASSQEKITVGFPHQAAVAVSSLVLGTSCEEGPSQSGLQRRQPRGASDQELAHPQIDPLRTSGCRLKSESTDSFAATGVLHALIRIYPPDKLEKQGPESWTANFVLRSKSGSVAMQKELPFTVDSGSGYVASVETPLTTPGISPGPYILDVQIHGPGVHGDLKQSRSISILAPLHP
ncbi:MAG: hypothetical protein ACR2JE_18170 [Acidobacteriaceae bacterium]